MLLNCLGFDMFDTNIVNDWSDINYFHFSPSTIVIFIIVFCFYVIENVGYYPNLWMNI